MGVLGNKATYNAYYGDFRGVDFSSDHTQVISQRLAYAVNMYKDYQSGQGRALETIPGFRRRVELPDSPAVLGIHELKTEGGGIKILIHAGDRLYLWKNYPLSANVTHLDTITLPSPEEGEGGLRHFTIALRDEIKEIKKITITSGEELFAYTYDADSRTLTLEVKEVEVEAGDNLNIAYVEGVISKDDALYVGMKDRRSASFVFNNRLYIIDGKNYLVFDGETVKNVLDEAYIPTTYINIIPAGENADIGTEYEQRNILQPKFKHTFVADGATTNFYMNEGDIEEISEVKVYGEKITDGWEFDPKENKITFAEAPIKPEEARYPEFSAGIEITAKKTMTSVSGITDEREDIFELITECTIACVFDNRVFFSGNPAYPNHVFYCGRNITGYVDPTYFGVYNYMQDGVGLTPISGMIPVADTLMVLKGDTQQDGSVFFHSATQTGENLVPVIYPATQGLHGIGCLGACVNFLDDPIFVSRLGVEGISQYTSAKYERGIEHRSSLIDAKLVNLPLGNAVVEEWNGYLCVLIDGKMFLADSRQRYTHDIGTMQYEWYYVEDVGIFDGQYTEYKYASVLPEELSKSVVKWRRRLASGEEEIIELPLELGDAAYNYDRDEYEDLRGRVVNPPDEEGKETSKVYFDVVEYILEDPLGGDPITYYIPIHYKIHELYDRSTGDFVKYQAFLCETRENKTGGVFRPAVMLKTIDNNLFFGTEGGHLCSFNFDMRDREGYIAPRYYTFDERTIISGCATKMDNCGIPHLTKSTVKKSTVIKTKAMQTSAAKVRVRTNRKPYEQIGRINSTMFSFDSMDFSDFSFVTSDQSLFAVKEKEKKWVEKQYYIYSDEYMKPFAIYYVCYRYTVAGRYKE